MIHIIDISFYLNISFREELKFLFLTSITEIRDTLQKSLDNAGIYIVACGTLRPELGVLDLDDRDTFLHETSFRSRHQSGEIICPVLAL